MTYLNEVLTVFEFEANSSMFGVKTHNFIKMLGTINCFHLKYTFVFSKIHDLICYKKLNVVLFSYIT